MSQDWLWVPGRRSRTPWLHAYVRLVAGQDLKSLFSAFVRRDEQQFLAAANALIANEEAKHHVNLARELRRILEGGGVRAKDLKPAVPLAKSRGSSGEKVPLADVLTPQRTFDDLVLTSEVRDQLKSLAAEYDHLDKLVEHRVPPRRKMLFFGPPGCGKTSAAEALAHRLEYPLAIVRIDALLSSYLGETLQNLRNVMDGFTWEPHVVLFDEFDALGRSRDDPQEHGEIRRVVSGFLMMLEQFAGRSILIAATNHDDLLDHALWRRFDDIFQFARPDAGQISSLLARLLATIPMASLVTDAKTRATADLILDHIPPDGISHAAVEYIVWDAYRSSLVAGETAVNPSELSRSIGRAKARPW